MGINHSQSGNPLSNENIGGNQIQGMFNSMMQNPIQWLTQRKINIPEQYANDPHGAVQYLLNNGKMSQEQLNKLTQMASQFGIKLT